MLLAHSKCLSASLFCLPDITTCTGKSVNEGLAASMVMQLRVIRLPSYATSRLFGSEKAFAIVRIGRRILRLILST